MLQRLARSREVITSIRLRNGAVTLMVAAIFVNLVQLNISPSGSGFKPFPKYDTADITKIARKKGEDESEIRICSLNLAENFQARLLSFLAPPK